MNKKNVQPKGAALLIFIVFFMISSLVFVLSIGKSAYSALASYRALEQGKISLYGAEAGVEDALYRHRQGMNYSGTESFSFGDVDVATVRTLLTDRYQIISEGNADNAVRTSELEFVPGAGVSFNFGLQGGNGGVYMNNNSKVYGNVFSNQTIEGQGNATIFGDVIAAGSAGMVRTIHATGSAWTHSLDTAVIDKDAHYYSAATRIATIVGGNSYPGTPDQTSAEFPIKDSIIEDTEAAIESSGTIITSASPECAGGTYVIDTDTTLDNVKIECDVEMKKQGGSTVITIAGPVWITGNLSFSSGPSIVASPSLGKYSVPIIVDNPSNRLTSSQVTVNQATDFTSATSSSYVIIISMNNSAENGGTEKAINLAQSANGKVLVYASHGLIDMGNSIALKEVTGYKIAIGNGASVTYESGLASILFTTGPGGGYTVTKWREIE